MTSIVRRMLCLLAATTCLAVAPIAHAAYPDQAVRLVVAWPAGGSADSVGRQIGLALSAGLGQTVYVENVAGASGNVGTGAFTRARPDGYTLLLANSTTNSAGPNLFSKLPFRPVEDFAPISLAAIAPSVLIMRPNSPYKSFKDIVAAAKANPGKLNFGSGGNGNSAHLSAALFASTMGIDVTHVPYKGNAPANVGLLSGQVDFMFDNGAVAMIKGGQVRALATTGDVRSSALPDVPTFKELGYPAVHLSTWYGLAAPRGTPQAVIDKIHAALVDGLKKTDTVQKLKQLGFEVQTQTPAEFSAYWKVEIDRYRDLVKLSGARVE